MRFSEIQLAYWTDTDGVDFEQFDEFAEGLDHQYFLTVIKKRSDAAGGGIYDFVIKIIENFSLLDLANSYVEDGVKVLIGYSLKSILEGIKKLFAKNADKDPGIEKIILDFKDTKIIMYEIFPKGLESNFDRIMIELFKLRRNHFHLFEEKTAIHIPIFNHKDSYNLCDLRVKLDVDEPIVRFEDQDYLNLWGIKSRGKYYVYSVINNELEERKFYTQNKYNKLFRGSSDFIIDN